MSVKSRTVIKFIAMIIAPFILEVVLVWLEYWRVVQPEGNVPLHSLFYIIFVVSIFRFTRRCKKCGRWQAVKEISREEINRMEHPSRGRTKHKKFQVRLVVTKKCKYCGAERQDEVIKEIKEKQ